MTKQEVEKRLLKRGKYVTIISTNYGSPVARTYRKSGITLLGNCMVVKNTWNIDYTIEYDDIVSIMNKRFDIHANLVFGADPELFFVRDGVMVPSTGIMQEDTQEVTRDGFQVELHPRPTTCRQLTANGIRDCLRTAESIARNAGCSLSFALAHVADKDVWKNTPSETKRFGCHPTENAQEESPHRSDGMKEKFRAGGGHIHLGGLRASEKKNLPTIVKIMDIVVGNTLVLLDRDEANITRRKNYGRAGEYRPKPYGLEYRVPSNFWLKHYVLWSLATGLMRNAIVIYRSREYKKLFKMIDMKDVRDAINNNDYDLAMSNFNKYIEFLKETGITFNSGVSLFNKDKFISWVTTENPLHRLGKMTDKTILNHWLGLSAVSSEGFETFINNFNR